jgi:putative transposase
MAGHTQYGSLRGAPCYHESLSNFIPADVYFGRAQTILLERERIKQDTIRNRRLQYQNNAA